MDGLREAPGRDGAAPETRGAQAAVSRRRPALPAITSGWPRIRGPQGRVEPKAPGEAPTERTSMSVREERRLATHGSAVHEPRRWGRGAGTWSAEGAGEHESERTPRCVSERAEPVTHGWPVHEPRRGGEGGIRTLGAFAHRFSRAAPSTTRTPLRRGGYQRSPPEPETRPAAAAQRCGTRGRIPAAAWYDLDGYRAAAA